MARVGFSGLEAATGELNKEVEPGIKEVQIGNVELVECGENSKHPGHPMLKIPYRIIGEEDKGRMLFDNILVPGADLDEMANELSANKLKAIFLAMGAQVEGDEFDTEQMVGETLRVEVKLQKDRQDPTQMRARIVNYLRNE